VERDAHVSSYLALLASAEAMGRADGRLAADLEPDDPAARSGSVCRGRGLAEFARWL
jgi:hypothetical protein